MEVDGFDDMTIHDGLLVANVAAFDRTLIAQQLGLMPPDGSPAERGMKALYNAQTAVKTRLAKRR